MYKKNLTITILFLFLAALYVHSQETEMQVSKKLTARIKLSEQTGNNKIPDGFYDDKDSVYFSVELTNEEEFSKGMITDLIGLRIEQSGRTIMPGNIGKNSDYNGRTFKLIASYYKVSLDIYQPFEFKFATYSGAFQIPDKYWPKYHEFVQYFNTGKDLSEKFKYIESYKQLQNVLPGWENNKFYKRFIQYDQIINELIPANISGTLINFENRLTYFRSIYGTKDEITTEEIDNFKLTLDSLTSHKELFAASYDEVHTSKIIELSKKHVKLIEDYNGLYRDCKNKWKATMMNIFESGEYNRRANQFTVYSNLLSRILCLNKTVQAISLFDSVDMTLVTNQRIELPFIKKYLDVLYEMNWEQEFLSVISVINDEIKTNKRIMTANQLNNFKNQINSEDQPNYYILSAFDELAKGRDEGFITNIKLAIAKCTDKELLYQLELWIFAYDIKRLKIGKDVLENINIGMELDANAKPDDAFAYYKKASILNDRFALSYFLMGRVELISRKNSFTADQYFNDALRSKPDFALARIYHLEILIQNQQYKDVLNEITALFNNSYLNIWYIYYLNAKVLFLMKDNSGALSILNGSCSNFNKNSFEQFLLMGDIYLEMNKCEDARKNYQEAGKIRPDSQDFVEKMRTLNNKCTQ
jgi:hypothetical protein